MRKFLPSPLLLRSLGIRMLFFPITFVICDCVYSGSCDCFALVKNARCSVPAIFNRLWLEHHTGLGLPINIPPLGPLASLAFVIREVYLLNPTSNRLREQRIRRREPTGYTGRPVRYIRQTFVVRLPLSSSNFLLVKLRERCKR